MTLDSPLYPERLARIMKKPLVLYYKGVLRELENEVCIAEVGTRLMTEYGSHAAYSVAYDLAKAGAVVVSGMAKGVDGMAHRGALDAGGYTVAVLGNGLDRAYPAEHLSLMEEIIKNGVVISEFKPFTTPNGRNFPLRNRIISGLSQGTVVIEAPTSSGALITADYAAEQGRDIFALPGKVGEYNSSGTNQLIKNGAKIVTSASDILLEYQNLYRNTINLNNIPSIKSTSFRSPLDLRVAAPMPRIKTSPEKADINTLIREEPVQINEKISKAPAEKIKPDFSGLPEKQVKILTLIFDEGRISSDEIVMKSGMAVGQVLAELTMLEIMGKIIALPGGMYTLN